MPKDARAGRQNNVFDLKDLSHCSALGRKGLQLRIQQFEFACWIF
jgi:hypothetical protein